MKSTPANLCVIAHFIGRGACVYCRLLSVLLMQIIKFGGKLVVNPRCSSIEHHNFKRNKAIFYVLLLNRLHRGEQQHITDRCTIGEQHHQTIHAEAQTARGGQAVLQRVDVVVVYL